MGIGNRRYNSKRVKKERRETRGRKGGKGRERYKCN